MLQKSLEMTKQAIPLLFKMLCEDLNPSRPVHLRIYIKIKINLNFYFHTSLKPFEAPQRSVKIKI